MKTTFKKKAFTLIELLIVIAIIGILFIVLVSKVDFATDKAKMTGVQTDFRSFQMAFDTVAKENAGFNTFGWDTGDTDGNRERNSYDKGDTDQDGVLDADETWIGRKVYSETWTGIYTLVKPSTTGYDSSTIFALETAINKNLDPKLHISIAEDGTITMANQAQDPWKTEYHGFYLTNAENDNKDRGAIVMYSDGPNKTFGSEQTIANGVVSITNPGNSIQGQDDMSIVSCYTYVNGYGEVENMSTGFSSNQSFLTGSNNNSMNIVNPDANGAINLPTENPSGTIDSYSWSEIKMLAQAGLSETDYKNKYGIELGQKVDNTYILVDFDNYGGFVFMYDAGINAPMNSSLTNVGGYALSELAPQIEALYTNLTDAALKAAIKEVTIKCNDGSENYAITHTYTCHMFLASHRELGGIGYSGSAREQYLDVEGTVFSYFTSNTNLQRVGGNTLPGWWSRSAGSYSTRHFFHVDHTGETNVITSPDRSLKVIPVFVIG